VKQDLDRLMEERGLDAAFVSGAVHGNPAMYYMTNGAGLTRGLVIKKRGEEPLLLCWPMEREEAAASGLSVINGRWAIDWPPLWNSTSASWPIWM
jgi:hypothetical protein